MQLEGNIFKMRTELATPVKYFLQVGEKEIPMNDFIGKKISMNFSGQINCISCGKKTKTSFHQGFCYNCLQTAPQAAESVIRPELSKSHFGIARDMEWAKKHDLINHFVYLAVSSDVKVGVTRNHQIPTRWIDQGAHEAIEIVEVPNRYLAGITEVALKDYVGDKTNWRTMLKNDIVDENLVEWRERLKQHIPDEAQDYYIASNTETNIDFPVKKYPVKPKSLNIIKDQMYTGKLTGIKGNKQFLAIN